MKTSTVTPLFITFLISPCHVTSTYQVSLEIYGGIFYKGITLNVIVSAQHEFSDMFQIPNDTVFIIITVVQV